MPAHKPIAVAIVAAFAIAASALPVAAVTRDSKVVAPTLCEPYAPDTTAAELQETSNGIYNPGTTIEKVICALPRDAENEYASAGDLLVQVYYRVLGAAPGRLTCTLFVGNTTMGLDPVVTHTVAGDAASSGGRDWLELTVGTQPAPYTMVPNALICAISPKTVLGAIYLTEKDQTDIVDPPA